MCTALLQAGIHSPEGVLLVLVVSFLSNGRIVICFILYLLCVEHLVATDDSVSHIDVH